MNLLLSHPDVCISSGETHSVFKGTKWDPVLRKIKKRVFYDFPIRLLSGQDLFGYGYYETRKTVPNCIRCYIDRILYKGRFTAMIDTHNSYKSEEVLYTKEELGQCRLLTKGLNGVVFTVDMFREMYPDAVFFGFVRNGLAICEGYVRRGFTADRVAHCYNLVGQKLLESSEQMVNYHLLNYEDMVKNPLEFMHRIYAYAGLDISKVKKVRLQSKKIMNVNGKRSRLKGGDRQIFWYDPTIIHQYIKRDINKNQIQQLSVRDKKKFMSIAGDVMEKLGYVSGQELA